MDAKEHIAEAEEILIFVRETNGGPTAMEALTHVLIAMVKVQIASNMSKGF